MGLRTVVLICLAGITACAATSYKYYGIAPLPGESLRGRLLGPSEKDDLPLERCQPDDFGRGKCVVLFTEEYERVLTDLDEAQKRLKACEESKAQ